MFLLNGIHDVLVIILDMIGYLILASVVVSWVNADPSNQLVAMIRGLTEPMYRPIRKLTSGLPGPIDWAPFILILVLVFVRSGILPYIKALAGQKAIMP